MGGPETPNQILAFTVGYPTISGFPFQRTEAPQNITSPAFKAFKTVAVVRSYGKAFLFPKGTPRELVDIVQKAAVEMIKDPAFTKEADMLNPGAPRYAGVEAARVYRAGIQADPESVKYMKGILTEKFGVKFE